MKVICMDYSFKIPELRKFTELSLKLYIQAKKEEEKKKHEQAARQRKCV